MLVPDWIERILKQEVEFRFARSSGPGGQNVNKTETKVHVFWRPLESALIPENLRSIVLENLKRFLTLDGNLVVTCDERRSQIQNKETAARKFQELIIKCSHRPKVRKKTQKSRSTRIRERDSKQRQSLKKKDRSSKFL